MLTRENAIGIFIKIANVSADDIAKYAVSSNDGFTIIRAVLKNRKELVLTYKSDYVWRLETAMCNSNGFRRR